MPNGETVDLRQPVEYLPEATNGAPSGSQAPIDRSVTSLTKSWKNGLKFSSAFTVPTSWGSFTGGAEKQYETISTNHLDGSRLVLGLHQVHNLRL